METTKKKLSNEQLQRRIEKAVVHLDRTKNTKSVYFDDKGVRLTCDDGEGYAIVETGFHKHVFQYMTSHGYSRPALYISSVIDIALSNDCIVKDAKGEQTRSYQKLLDVVKEKEDLSQYNICWFFQTWMLNIYAPLYSIGETESEAFLLYETYVHNLARMGVILREKKEDMTTHDFVKEVVKEEMEMVEKTPANVLFKALTDEERAEQEMKAMQEMEQEQAVQQQQE